MSAPDTLRFDDRVVIVTGAGGGLGKSHALEFAARGARVIVNDLGGNIEGTTRSAAPADAVVDQIRKAGGTAIANYESVGTRAGGESLVSMALDHFGRVDAVVNNAGNQRNNRFELMTDEEFDAVLDVHLKGAFYVSQAAYRRMVTQRYGRLVFTSSSSGTFGNYIRTNYAAAKMGLIGMMHSIAIEGARDGIKANAVLPNASGRLGAAPTTLLHPEWAADNPTVVPGFERLIPTMRPEYVTPLVAYLASEQCQSTHAIWSAYGGHYSKVVISKTAGWHCAAGRPPTVEEISAHWQDIERGAETLAAPLSVSEEARIVVTSARERG